jgi:hypothetical protein
MCATHRGDAMRNSWPWPRPEECSVSAVQAAWEHMLSYFNPIGGKRLERI